MSGFEGTWLVAGRELREAFRRRTFWIVAGLVLAASAAGMIVPELVGDDGPPRYDVGVVAASPNLPAALQALAGSLDIDVDIRELPSEAAAEVAVEDGDVDAAAVGGDAPSIVAQAGEHDRLVALLRQAMQAEALTTRLEDAGLTSEQATEVLATPAPRIQEVDADGADRRAAAVITAVALYILLFMLMIQVANGTAIEKANRISEVLLAIVRPGALLFGKVLGVGITGLLTMAAGIAPVVVKLGLGGDLPDGIGSALLGGAAWFVLGLAVYLTAAGALGALVERQEEAGSAVTPLSIVLIGSYLVGQSGADSPLGAVLAVVPLSSPLVMPSRIAIGAATGAEIALSLALGVAAVAVMARVSAVVYRRAIVRTGSRLKLSEVL